MASRNTHPTGKPAGLSPADLPLPAEPVAYLTNEPSGQRAAPGALSATNAVAASRTPEVSRIAGAITGHVFGRVLRERRGQGVSGFDDVRRRFLLRNSRGLLAQAGTRWPYWSSTLSSTIRR